MSKTRISIARIPTTTEGQFVEVEVSYSKGGINYFTYNNEPRGYWLGVQPITVRSDLGVSFMAFSGTKAFLEDAKRFSAKRLAELAAQGKSLPKYDQLMAHVLAKNGLTLAEAKDEKAVAGAA